MEPNNPGNTNIPTSYPQGPVPEQPKKRWPFSRKITIIIGVILALIVVFLVVLFSKDSKKKTDGTKAFDRSSVSIKRPGFENAGDGIGDPLGLISKPTNKVVQYGGTNVVQACTILTIKDIRDAGLKIELNKLIGSIQRTFMDGEGPGILAKGSDNFLPFDDDSNYCMYALEEGMISLTVYQPAYANQKAIGYELEGGYAQGPDIEGFQTYNETHVNKDQPNDSTTFLRSSDISAALRIDTPDKTTREKLIKLAAQRLRQGLATPTPVEEFVYDSPILTGKVVNSCALVTNADFKAILGVDSGPYVDEMMTSAVGIVEDPKTNEPYNFVTHHCKRRSPEGSTKDNVLTINVDSYETSEAAKAITTFERTQGSARDVQPVTPTIGDESYYADTASVGDAVVVRKGRIVVKISYYLPRGNDDVTPAQRIQALTPLATSIANDRLKGY